MKQVTEILAPAGSYESLQTAIAAGADAVYTGGNLFGARAYANNLDEKTLLEAIDFTHLHGKKIYLTVNTLLKEKELKGQLYSYLLPYYEHGLDAVIVQDVGVMQFVKEHFPDLAIHASTQMTITNAYGAKFLKEQGAERVVTARELQLGEVAEIVKETGIEIESFVHGALCYCYSGQCLFSSLIGGRSGNRGQCAQPCRLQYQLEGAKKPEYLMSLKDICTLDDIPALVDAGIYSFKIEGRMKKPEYVAAVTSMYRKYTDIYLQNGRKGYRVDPKDKEILMDIYNRGGFHSGYYQVKNGREMLSLSRPNHAGVEAVRIERVQGKSAYGKALTDLGAGDVLELSGGKENYTLGQSIKKGGLVTVGMQKKIPFQKGMVLNRVRNTSLVDQLQKTYVNGKIQEKINGILILSLENSAKLTVKKDDITVTVTGAPAEKAQNQPMTAERIEKQMRKTGNTPFVFDHLEIHLDGELFVPVQTLNELRRAALEELEKEICEQFRRNHPEVNEKELTNFKPEPKKAKNIGGKLPLYASVETREQFEEVCRAESISRIYVDSSAFPQIWNNDALDCWTSEAHRAGKEIFLIMPYIFRKETIGKFEKGYAGIASAGFDGMLLRNYESFQFLKEKGYEGKIVLDHNLYQFNQEAERFWKKLGISDGTAPVELNYRELKDLGLSEKELIVYGYLPMMVSAQCIQKTTGGCTHRPGVLRMKDRYQKTFSIKNVCDYCYNVIYNTAPLVLTDQKEEIEELAPAALRLWFTIENAGAVRECINRYERVFLKDETVPEEMEEFTRGHFKRGIK